MCGICKTVNCIRRRLFGCGCNDTGYNGGCESNCNGCNSRFTEPDTNIVCANQRDSGFTPCCEDDECRCHKHHHCCH